MKRSFLVIPFLFLVFCFTGCGSSSNGTPDDSADPTDTEAADTEAEDADTGSSDPSVIPECGNKIVETGEICDSDAKKCSEINPSYISGYVVCKADCLSWDESGCKSDTPAEPTDQTDPTDPTDDPTNPTDPSDPTDSDGEIEIGEPLGEVTVSNKPDGFDGYFLDGPGEEEALIFYPGANIEPDKYLNLFTLLAERGVDVFLMKMTMNMAVLSQNKADDIYKKYTSYQKYYLSGHSMGGAMIANYAAKTSYQVDGIFMLAAYPTENLTAVDYPILFIYGSEDGVIDRDKLQTGFGLTPADSVKYEIPGGNHAYFGDYGEQSGDGTATISHEQQQKITVREILKLIR